MLQFGEEGVAVARARYPMVPAPTWWRWLKAVRAELAMSQPGLPALAPAPVGVPTDPGGSPLDYFEAELARMRHDIELLRSHAIAIGQDGSVRLRNPVAMATVVRLRNQALTLYVQRQEAATSAERLRSYRELLASAISHVLGSAPTEAEAAVMARLRAALRAADEQWREFDHVADPRRAAAAAAESGEVEA
jgi:hypothetical protein